MKLVSFVGPRGPYENIESSPEGITFRKGDSHMLFVPSPATILSLKDSKFGGLLRDCEEQAYILGKGLIRGNPCILIDGALWANDEHAVYITVKGWCDQDPVELILRPDELWAVREFRPSQVTLSWRDLQFILQHPYLLRDDKEDLEDDE